MYLHIGNSFTVRTKDIIGIFDFDKATFEKTTEMFLKKAEDEGNLINTWEDFPKSFVVVNDRGEIKVFVSDISSASLLGRSGLIKNDYIWHKFMKGIGKSNGGKH